MSSKKATIYDHVRMCKTEKVCNDCPLHRTINGTNLACDDFLMICVDKANEIILKWSKEHPVETRQSKFLKMFPNARLGGDGVIGIAPCAIEKNKHITSSCSCPVAHGFNNCDECRKEYWLTEVDENE